MARYQLRYTQDLAIAREGDTITDVVLPWPLDFKMHVWDTHTATVVWQSAPSVRYGMTAIAS